MKIGKPFASPLRNLPRNRIDEFTPTSTGCTEQIDSDAWRCSIFSSRNEPEGRERSDRRQAQSGRWECGNRVAISKDGDRSDKAFIHNAYAVLTVCRILYSASHRALVSKNQAYGWTMETVPPMLAAGHECCQK